MKEVVAIRLPASVKDDLDWSSERALAEQLITSGKALLWEIDFSFTAHPLRSQDTAMFFTCSRAIEEFAKHVGPAFKEHTSGVCLYRGSVFEQLLDSHSWQSNYREWLEALREKAYQHELKQEHDGHDHYYRLFCAHMFAEYLDRLISFFPDEITPIAYFTYDHSPATMEHLLSKERFQHVQCLISDQMVVGDRPAVAICMPSDPYCDRRVLEQLDNLFLALQQQGIAYRLICEEKLTEEWDGLDQLIVITDAVSPQGKRRLQGFCAAGGEVLYRS